MGPLNFTKKTLPAVISLQSSVHCVSLLRCAVFPGSRHPKSLLGAGSRKKPVLQPGGNLEPRPERRKQAWGTSQEFQVHLLGQQGFLRSSLVWGQRPGNFTTLPKDLERPQDHPGYLTPPACLRTSFLEPKVTLGFPARRAAYQAPWSCKCSLCSTLL